MIHTILLAAWWLVLMAWLVVAALFIVHRRDAEKRDMMTIGLLGLCIPLNILACFL